MQPCQPTGVARRGSAAASANPVLACACAPPRSWTGTRGRRHVDSALGCGRLQDATRVGRVPASWSAPTMGLEGVGWRRTHAKQPQRRGDVRATRGSAH